MQTREMVDVYEGHRAAGGDRYDDFIRSHGLDPMMPVLVYFDRVETAWLTLKGTPLAVGGKVHVGV